MASKLGFQLRLQPAWPCMFHTRNPKSRARFWCLELSCFFGIHLSSIIIEINLQTTRFFRFDTVCINTQENKKRHRYVLDTLTLFLHTTLHTCLHTHTHTSTSLAVYTWKTAETATCTFSWISLDSNCDFFTVFLGQSTAYNSSSLAPHSHSGNRLAISSGLVGRRAQP